MSEKQFPITPVGLAYLCDDCGKGLVMATEQEPSSEGLIKHQCTVCGFIYYLPKRYPTINWIFPKVSDIIEVLTREKENEKAQNSSCGETSPECSATSTQTELREVPDNGSSPITGEPIGPGSPSDRG